MVNIVDWWKRLFGQNPVKEQYRKIQLGDLQLVPAGQTATRSEESLPGTDKLELIIQLVPPPINPNLVTLPVPQGERDYPPNPFAAWSLTFEANERFDCAELSKLLYAQHDKFCHPSYHVCTPEGRITFLTSSDAPPYGIALIPAWSLGEWAKPDKEKIFEGAHALAKVLAEQPQGFRTPDISPVLLEKQLEQVAQLTKIKPKTAKVIAYHPEGRFWSGREIWVLLHQLGLKWGDMDCFQWADPTHQTDYLIWVEVDDGDLGYALPERIAAGQQNFRALNFSFHILRSPAPEHVLDQLLVMTAACQTALSCNLKAFLDDDLVYNPEELRKGVKIVVQSLDALGLESGSNEVCMVI